MNNIPSKKRILAFAFLTYFLIASIFSSVFILTNAEHEHDHRGANECCSICVQLQSANNILIQLGMAFAGMSIFSAARIYSAIEIRKIISFFVTLSTPVILKIRMNN